MTSSPRAFLLLLVALTFALANSAQSSESLHLRQIGDAPNDPWRTIEFRVENVPPAENPFDPEQIRVDALFTTPSGKALSVPAFWFQDFTRELKNGAEVLTPRGSGEWRLRFTPTEPGDYRVQVTARLGGNQKTLETSATVRVSSASPSRPHGWVRVGSDSRWFETSDGRPLRLIGENVCWGHARGSFDFDQWFDGLANSGQNFARLWLSPWSMNLEHSPGTLNRYNQSGAWVLDHVFKLAEERGIYLLLCFDHHGMYQIENRNWGGSNNFWKTNPYNAALGGPCDGPNAFFTDPRAQALYEKRLRYLVGRYGASEYLLAWQFFNEIDNVYAPNQSLVPADVVAWHRRMGQWLKANDPYRHLVTTSLTGGSDRADIWTIPEMDFSMYHSYADPAPGRHLARLSADFVERYKKPVMIGEFGVSPRDWAIASDPHLRGFRQAQWGAALGGSVGTAMSWWWEDIHTDNAYPLYAAMRSILARAGWFEGNWLPLAVQGPDLLPVELGDPVENGEVFNASVSLSGYRRQPVRSALAIADKLAAERGAEFLSSYLHGTRSPEQHRPLRLIAHFANNGKVTYRVNSVAGDGDLVVRIDGAEAQRTRLFDRDGLPAVNREVDRELSVPVPAGKHVIELENTGLDWIHLDQIRLEAVRPAHFGGAYRYQPDAVGLRSADGQRAVLYVCSPYIVHPAGSLRFNAPALSGQTITTTGWVDGNYAAQWLDAANGKPVANTVAVASAGRLVLAAPEFSEDLAVVVERR